MSRLRSSPRLRAALFCLLPAILLAAGSAEARKAVAYLAPFLVLLVALLAERYPGEGLISRSRSAATRRREPPLLLSLAHTEPRARRGPLLAFAQAGRAPPAFR